MILEKPSRKGRLFLFAGPKHWFDVPPSFVVEGQRFVLDWDSPESENVKDVRRLTLAIGRRKVRAVVTGRD